MNFEFSKSEGFTLIETLIALGIFAIIATSVYFSYSNILDITIIGQMNSMGLTVLDNELEIIRNIKYQDVGIQGGSPVGILLAEKSINFASFNFILKTTVRNIDDPFDGVIGGTPNDTAPADYKIVELELTCSNCSRFIPARTTTIVAPANLENSSNRGALFVKAINASGQPVVGANVTVINSSANPAITINDVTNNSGQLQLVDIATSSLAYQITVSKSGYSMERTYPIGDPQNPNPVKPHATVVSQQVTEITFVIDRFSTQTLTTRDKLCQTAPDIDFSQQGAKLIGTNPNVLKYAVNDKTDSRGNKIDTNIEWDSYSLQNTDAAYDLAGTSILSPFNVNPNSNYTVSWLMEPKNLSSLLVIVQTAGGQMIDGASISLTKAGFGEMKVSGRNYISQTDWSGGRFTQKSLNIEEANPSGELKLKQINGKYASMSLEWLESQTFDFGAAATIFYKLRWNPLSQPLQAGPNSLKFQIAANNDNITWNYVGPDGGQSSYYTSPNSSIYSGHNGSKYLRYKVYLITENHDFTPRLEDINVEFSSSCIPSGQSFFSGLANGAYTLTIQKSGYQTLTTPVNIGSGWQAYRATLVP